MKTVRSFTVLCCLLGVAAFACGSSGDDEGTASDNVTETKPSDLALDVNDISILFPLKNKEPVPSLGMDMKGSSGKVDVFPKAVMEDVAKFQEEPEQGVTSLKGDRADWRVVGFRFDPCAAPTPGVGAALSGFPTQKITNLDKDIKDCEIHIRLIAQPFSGGRDVDTTAHLVFSFGQGNKAARDRIIGELQELKSKSPAETSGVPLSVHPGLAADADGSFAKLVQDFLVTELSQAQLMAVASMGTQGGDPWVFAQGQVKGGHWEVAPITGFGLTILGNAKVKSQQDFAGSQITPEAIPGENNFIATTTPLFKGDPSKEDLKLALKVNNPEIAGLFNTDCVSCHTATERTINKKVASGPERFKIPKGVTGYVEKRNANTTLPADEAPVGPNKSAYNFRNFGYFGGQATISHRTVNETAQVVDHINRDLLKKKTGPGPVCDDAKVWTCFRDGKAAAECLSEANGCKPAEKK